MILQSLYAFLTKFLNENLLMPCTSKKNPIFKHKDNQWSWDLVMHHKEKFGKDKYQAILLKTLIVIDFDDKKLAQQYEELFPILTTCPKASTKKGFHYYFVRTDKCDLYALYDMSRCFGFAKEQIDFKTICSTGTAGVVIIPPSPDKKWVRNLWKTPIPRFDGEIFDHFVEKWGSKKYKIPKEVVNDNIIYDPKNDEYDTNIGEEYFVKISVDDLFLNEIQDIVSGLDVKRSQSYITWIETLWCLKNLEAEYTSNDDQKIFFKNLWLNFSSICKDKYVREDSLQLWNNTVPRTNGLRYGTLKHWHKIDNPDLYTELEDHDKNIITNFITKNFLYGKSKIENISIRRYDDKSYIFVNINELLCKNIKDEHDKPQIFIIISHNEVKEKCRECNSIIYKIQDLPPDIKAIADIYLKNKIESPEKFMTKFIKKENPEMYGNIDLVLSPPKENIWNDQIEYDIENEFCCNPECKHVPAHNKAIVKTNRKVYCIYCLITNYFHPDKNGSKIPDNIYPFVSNINNLTINIQNNVNNGIINNNGISTESILATKDFYDDNLPFYKDNENIHIKFLKSFSFAHGYIAEFINAIWPDEFRFFDKKWYQFENHLWKFKEEPVLNYRLNHDLCDIYDEVKNYYRCHPSIKNSEDKIKLLNNLILKLNNTNFKNGVMTQCQITYSYTNKDFSKKINKANILPFNNGVYDFDTHIFRNGKPEDAMTMSTNIDYIKYDPDNIGLIMQELLQFLDDIMPNKIVLEYLLKVSALSLTRNIEEQLMWILTGSGNNGKSVYLNLMGKTLGDFSVACQPEIITRKAANSNQSNESISSLEFATHVVMSEPDYDDIIRAGRIKQICNGEDKISTRGNYEKQKNFIPTFKLMLVCNNIPSLSENDFAIWKRIRLIEFKVLFCENPNKENPYQKLIDKKVIKQTSKWASYMAGYLIHWLKIYEKNGLNTPIEVINTTQNYKDDNDEWAVFRELHIIKENNCFIQWDELREFFREWHDKAIIENKISGKKLSKRADNARKYFNDKLDGFQHTSKNNTSIHGYIGWKLINN